MAPAGRVAVRSRVGSSIKRSSSCAFDGICGHRKRGGDAETSVPVPAAPDPDWEIPLARCRKTTGSKRQSTIRDGCGNAIATSVAPQEVVGSNPASPTKFLKDLQPETSFKASLWSPLPVTSSFDSPPALPSSDVSPFPKSSTFPTFVKPECRPTVSASAVRLV
jgi:hypothetical protein